ncbi:MAG: FdhF/YdeP family oxidoreductase [Pseudomonadota bacterium]
MSKMADIVGGGPKKVLYTLSTLKRIGLMDSAKALNAKNACKACGLGMGGQRGGMTNEQDDFPSVCNKSIQAQSTDIQPPIPNELFQHTLTDFQALSGREMEQLGRLNSPLHLAPGSNRFEPVSWDWAIERAASRLAEVQADRSFFYSSGRSSNEAGFVLQLLARLYGTNNVNNCSFYCHQATGEALKRTIGTGTATVELEDLDQCDLVFIIGANPASNHPRLLHKLQHCRERGGHVVVINPAREPGLVRFAVPKSARSMLSGGSWIASEYLQPNIGSDIAVFQGIAKSLLEHGAVDHDFMAAHTRDAEDYITCVKALAWSDITNATGLVRSDIERVASLYASADRAVFAWGMGMTHHLHGVQNIEEISNLALLRGMVGKRGAGLLPLRGHSNVQGIGTIGVKPVLAKSVFERMEQQLGVSLPETPGMDTLACLKAAHRGDMDAALIMGGNLYEATPDSTWAKEAFERIGFKLYLTTTLNRGHVRGLSGGEAIILPVTARDEEWQPTTQESMFNYVRLSDGGIQRLAHPRPEVKVLCDLGKRLMPGSAVDFDAFQSHRTIREAIATVVPGMEELADIDVARKEFHIRNRLLHAPRFNTEDGRARFQVHRLSEVFQSDESMPFRLMTVRSEGQFNSIIYEEKDSYRGVEHRNVLFIGEADSIQLQLAEGDRVNVISRVGVLENLEIKVFDLPAGNVSTYYPEANVLVGRDNDPRSKTPAFKSVPVKIERATD